MLPTPNEISYFIEVAQTKNLSRAAERLGISQPSLSVALKKLEEKVSTQLVVRSKTGVTLTSSGISFQSQARHLLEHWKQIKSFQARDSQSIRGSYKLGMHPSVAIYSAALFIPQLLNKYSELSFDLHHDISRKITEKVISFELDFGIVVNPVRHPDLVLKKIATDEVRLWTHKDPSELQKMGSDKLTIICDPQLIQTQAIQKKLNQNKITYKRTLLTSNLEVIRELIESKAGIGILPNKATEKSNNLVPLASTPVYKDEHYLVYRHDYIKTEAQILLAKELFSLLNHCV